MEKKPLVSIIVPVYKVEQYLTECVNSILAQSYPFFELILVDDGSPDNCGKICDDFASQDHRIHVIHKKNGGLSDARNAGIDTARGEYITFIDSDDYVHQDYVKVMLVLAEKENADIVQCGFTSDSKDLGIFNSSKEQICIFDSARALHDLLRMRTVHVHACVKLYKHYLFDNIRYPYGRINEDTVTTYKLILAARSSIVCTNKNLYFYRLNSESLSHTFYTKRYDVLSFKDEIADFMGEKSLRFKNDIDYYEMRLAFWVYNDCIRSHNEDNYSMQQQKIRKLLSLYNPTKDMCGRKYYFMLKVLKWNWKLYDLIIRLT